MTEKVILRKMRAEEYPAYRDYFVSDYGREIMRNYGHPLERSIAMAQEDLIRSLPQGIESDGQELMCIEIDFDPVPIVIGYLWHAINAHDASTFIYDFYVVDAYRSRGYGKQAIKKLEGILHAKDIEQIKLRVAYQNKRALDLYHDVGFAITGYNMSKVLS